MSVDAPCTIVFLSTLLLLTCITLTSMLDIGPALARCPFVLHASF